MSMVVRVSLAAPLKISLCLFLLSTLISQGVEHKKTAGEYSKEHCDSISYERHL